MTEEDTHIEMPMLVHDNNAVVHRWLPAEGMTFCHLPTDSMRVILHSSYLGVTCVECKCAMRSIVVSELRGLTDETGDGFYARVAEYMEDRGCEDL
jgi:hypothetical protein